MKGLEQRIVDLIDRYEGEDSMLCAVFTPSKRRAAILTNDYDSVIDNACVVLCGENGELLIDAILELLANENKMEVLRFIENTAHRYQNIKPDPNVPCCKCANFEEVSNSFGKCSIINRLIDGKDSNADVTCIKEGCKHLIKKQ